MAYGVINEPPDDEQPLTPEAARQQPQYGDDMPPGDLLTEPDEEKAAKAVIKLWTDQDQLWSRYRAECLANMYRREGRTNVQVVKKDSQQLYEVWSWGRTVPHVNVAAKLCRKFAAFQYADPPQPEVEPDELSGLDRDGADFARRLLEQVNDQAYLDGNNTTRAAFDLASTFKSAFIWTYMHPQGKREAVQIEAHPMAVSADQPLSVPGPPDLMGQPTMQQADPKDATLRHVMPDGALSDTPQGAAMQWVPRLVEEVLTGLQVRPVPATASSVWDTHGMLIARFVSVGKLVPMFPKLFPGGKITDEQREKLTKRPGDAAKYLLAHLGEREQQRLLSLKEDEALAFVVTKYCGETSAYPEGLIFHAAGDGVLLDRATWVNPQSGQTLTVPLSQFKQFGEGKRDFYGQGAMDIVGPMQEIVNQMYGYEMDTADRNATKKVFMPMGSNISPEDYLNPDIPLLFFNGQNGKPELERIEPLDGTVTDLLDRVEAQMQEALGLSDIAQGLETDNVNSGRQAFAVIGQAQAALSESHQFAERAEIRRWKNQLEQLSAFSTKPQMLSFTGPDGQYQCKRWSSADLKGTGTVKLATGSFTLMTPQAKLDRAIQLSAIPSAGVTPRIMYDLLAEGVGPELGLRNDPNRVEIRRQIGMWEEGPPEGWMPQPPQPVVAGVGPDGMPITQMVAAPDPALLAIFPDKPSHLIPQTAAIRMEELGLSMAGMVYEQKPPEWQGGMAAEFEKMRQAAGVATVAEQQAAAAQQAAQAQAMAAASGPKQRDPLAEDRKAQQQTQTAVMAAQGGP